MYAYGLENNPYPSCPTPTEKDAKILGGSKHRKAKSAIVECIKELERKACDRDCANGDFRLITMIQDVGSGKTHLALHLKNLEGKYNSQNSFVDLSTISPKTMGSIYNAIIKGFDNEFFVQLRTKFLEYVRDCAEGGDSHAKKSLKYTFKNKLTGLTIKQKTEDIVSGNKTISVEHLRQFLAKRFNHYESILLRNVVTNSFDDVNNLEDVLGMMSAISKLSHKFLNKIIFLEIDELDGEKESIEFVKGVINSHLPACVLLLISTPAGYAEIQSINPSVFDRLEKANYKIDLAGSNSKDELAEIAIEYIKHTDGTGKFGIGEEDELVQKIRIVYEKYPEFRNVRSIINILYHAVEKSEELQRMVIDEGVIDDAISNAYPGLKIKQASELAAFTGTNNKAEPNL